MPKIFMLLVLSVVSTGLVACNIGPQVTGSGEIITEGRELPPFSRVEVDGATDVSITYGSAQSVKVIADDNIVPIISTEVEGETLKIEPDRSYTSSEQVRVEIVLPVIRSVEVEGSSNIEILGAPIEAGRIDRFSLEIEGSGDADIADMRAETVEIEIEGSGDVTLGGAGKHLAVVIEGSGGIDALGFVADEGVATIEGSGDIKIHVTSILRGTISGSGSILYRGDSPSVEKNISGSGEIRKI